METSFMASDAQIISFDASHKALLKAIDTE